MNNLLFALQWSYFKRHGQAKNYEALLKLQPNNLFQLSFWTQLIMVYKIQQLDIPDEAVFYLSDQTYMNVVQNLSEGDRAKINLKLGLATFIFQIQTNETLIRNIQQEIISGCSMQPLQSDKYDQLKFSVIKLYLINKSTFLSQVCLQKIVNFLKNKIQPSKQLKHIGDGILGTFIVQQLASGTVQINKLKDYISVHKKQKAFNSIKEYMIKNKTPQILNITIELAELFGQISEILKIFYEDSQKFYSIFWHIKDNNLQSQYNAFYFFMLKYASIRVITLHQIAYVSQPFPERNSSTTQLIKEKNEKIFYKFRMNPYTTAVQCVSNYLRLSKFNIEEKRIFETFSDPLSLTAVERRIWDDSFHNKVLNYCLWILLDQIPVKFKKNNIKSSIVQQNGYVTNLSLVLMHITMGYRIGTYVCFYPFQCGLFQDLFVLQSLPSILLNCSKFVEIPWVSYYINNQAGRVVTLENGFEFILRLMSLKINIFDENYLKIVNLIEHYFTVRNFKFLIKRSEQLKIFLNNLSTLKNFSQVSDRLKRALQKLTNQNV